MTTQHHQPYHLLIVFCNMADVFHLAVVRAEWPVLASDVGRGCPVRWPGSFHFFLHHLDSNIPPHNNTLRSSAVVLDPEFFLHDDVHGVPRAVSNIRGTELWHAFEAALTD